MGQKRRTPAELASAYPPCARLCGDIVEALLAADAPAEICVRWAQADCVNQRKLTDMCAGWDDDEGRLAAVKEIAGMRSQGRRRVLAGSAPPRLRGGVPGGPGPL